MERRCSQGFGDEGRSRDLLASWFDLTSKSLSAWRDTYPSVACNQHRKQPVECSVFNRSFSHPPDRGRHKCSAESCRPVLDQKGTRHCHCCDHWFRRAGWNGCPSL